MRRIVLLVLAAGLLSPRAVAGSSYVLPDGTNRAPAVTLHCVNPNGSATACGTVSNPLVTAPVAGNLISRTVSLSAGVSTVVFPAIPGRRYLAFQVPQGTSVWINVMGGPASPNGADCAYFSAGTFYESGTFVNRGSLQVYSPISATFSAWEG